MESLEAVLRDYVAVTSGVVEASQERTRQLATRLVDAGAASGEQISQLAHDIGTSADSTHRRLVSLVRAEVEQAASRADAQRREEAARLGQRVAALEAQLGGLRARLMQSDPGVREDEEPQGTPSQVSAVPADPTAGAQPEASLPGSHVAPEQYATGSSTELPPQDTAQ